MSADESIITDRLKACAWSLNFRQSDVNYRGGNSVSIEYGPAFWIAGFRYESLQPDQYRTLTAWINRRYGSSVPFMAHLPSRRYPKNNPGTTNAGLALSAYNGTTGSITLNKGNMAEGDMVSWKDSNSGQFVGEIVEVTSVSGGSTTFKTSPFARAPHGTPSPRVFEAQGRFRLMPSSVRIEDGHDKLYSVAFDARQMEGQP